MPSVGHGDVTSRRGPLRRALPAGTGGVASTRPLAQLRVALGDRQLGGCELSIVDAGILASGSGGASEGIAAMPLLTPMCPMESIIASIMLWLKPPQVGPCYGRAQLQASPAHR